MGTEQSALEISAWQEETFKASGKSPDRDKGENDGKIQV